GPRRHRRRQEEGSGGLTTASRRSGDAKDRETSAQSVPGAGASAWHEAGEPQIDPPEGDTNGYYRRSRRQTAARRCRLLSQRRRTESPASAADERQRAGLRPGG